VNEPERVQFLSLTNPGKQVFLAHLGLALTIAGRAFALDRHGEQAVAALTGLNELQHKVMSHIGALGTDAERYPDDVFWAVLDETAAIHSISDALGEAIVFAASRSD
jgi:hypothetical protein